MVAGRDSLRSDFQKSAALRASDSKAFIFLAGSDDSRRNRAGQLPHSQHRTHVDLPTTTEDK